MIAARTGLSQRAIVSTVLEKTDLATFIRLWTGDPVVAPTDVYRVLADGTAVRTATIGGEAGEQETGSTADDGAKGSPRGNERGGTGNRRSAPHVRQRGPA